MAREEVVELVRQMIVESDLDLSLDDPTELATAIIDAVALAAVFGEKRED